MKVRIGSRVICASRDNSIYNGVTGTVTGKVVANEPTDLFAGHYRVKFDIPVVNPCGTKIDGDLFLPSELINAKLEGATVWWDGMDATLKKHIRYRGKVVRLLTKPPMAVVQVTQPFECRHLTMKIEPDKLNVERKTKYGIATV